MENYPQIPQPPVPEKPRENVLFGIVGAFLFALIGGAIWYILYQVQFIAAISGIIAVVCAIKGYSVFAKGESVRGIVLSVVIAVLVIVLAWYLCLSTDVYQAYHDWYLEGEIDFTINFFEAVSVAWHFLADPEIALLYLKDLIIGFILCIVGCIGPVREAVRRAKPAPAPAWEEPTSGGEGDGAAH